MVLKLLISQDEAEKSELMKALQADMNDIKSIVLNYNDTSKGQQ